MADQITIEKIKKAISKNFSDQEVIQIIDYAEKGIYVVWAVPKNMGNRRNQYIDALHAVQYDTFNILGAFNPMSNDPDVYFSLPKNRVIYKK